MSSCEKEKLSPERSQGDVIDRLIYQALWSEVKDAEPSPQVWGNICRQIAASRIHQARRSTTLFSFLGNRVLMMLNEILYDRSWETRMAEYRIPVFLSDFVLLTA
jgi:hypothetical protein